MKQILLTIIQLLTVTLLLGQSLFTVEGKQIKTGTVSRQYHFGYPFQGKLSLYFGDSVLQYSNHEKTIVKTVRYSNNAKNESSTQIEYFRKNGEDSISKHFFEDELVLVYETRFDELNRIIYYGMKDYKADSTYDRGFEWFYEYRDSLTSAGRFNIQTVFVDDAYGDKRFHFRTVSEYDEKNKIIQEIIESDANDTLTKNKKAKDNKCSKKMNTFSFQQILKRSKI